MRCRGLQKLANPAYLGGVLFSGLPCVAPHCVPGGVIVVSIEAHSCFTILLERGTHPDVQHLAEHASIQLTLDRYSTGCPLWRTFSCPWTQWSVRQKTAIRRLLALAYLSQAFQYPQL